MSEYSNGPPSLPDMSRRLQRVEDKLDQRIASIDMLSSLERLFEAKQVSQNVAINDVEKRLTKLESSYSKVNMAVIGAFLLLLVQFIVIIATATGGAR